MVRAAVVVLFFLISTAAADASDELCNQLNSFLRSPFEKDATGKPKPRWVEYHWTGEWLVHWGYECRHSGETAAEKFCIWFPKNISQEFPEYLPLRILECRGNQFTRPLPHMGEWRTNIEFFDRIPKNVETLSLQIDMRDRAPFDEAVRLIAVPVGSSNSWYDLPPLEDQHKNPLKGR